MVEMVEADRPAAAANSAWSRPASIRPAAITRPRAVRAFSVMASPEILLKMVSYNVPALIIASLLASNALAVKPANPDWKDGQLRKLLQRIAPAPSPGSNSWAYGNDCQFVIKGADIVISKAPAGSKDGNLGNAPATDAGVCCARCKAAYNTWASANMDTILSNVNSNPYKALQALSKLSGVCLGWTFATDTKSCYLKNGVNFKLLLDLGNAAQSNNVKKYSELLSTVQTSLLYWELKNTTSSAGWYSGVIPNPALAAVGSSAFSASLTDGVNTLYSEPLPRDTAGCSTSAQRAGATCQRIYGVLKTNGTQSVSSGG